MLTWAYLAHLSLHVVVPPLLFLSPGLLTGHWTDLGLHRPVIAFMLCASTVILTLGWRCHRQSAVLWWGGIGGACLLAAVTGVAGGHDTGLVVGTAGSLLLAAAHWRNHRLWRGGAGCTAG